MHGVFLFILNKPANESDNSFEELTNLGYQFNSPIGDIQ